MCARLLIWYGVLCICVLGGHRQFIMCIILTHTPTHTHTHAQTDHTDHDNSFEKYRSPDEGTHLLNILVFLSLFIRLIHTHLPFLSLHSLLPCLPSPISLLPFLFLCLFLPGLPPSSRLHQLPPNPSRSTCCSRGQDAH